MTGKIGNFYPISQKPLRYITLRKPGKPTGTYLKLPNRFNEPARIESGIGWPL